MKGKFVVLLFILVSALGVFFVKKPAPQSSNQEIVTNGRYMPYSKQAFEAARDKKRILYFHANWCPVCRPLDQAFQSMMDQIPQNVVIFKTDYDTETQLKKQYVITYQHTFVQVDENDSEIKKWNGGNFNDVISNIY